MGFDSAWLTEHHFLEDGYCHIVMLIASEMAARTKWIWRIRYGC